MQTEFSNKFQSVVEIHFDKDFPFEDVMFMYDYVMSGKGEYMFENKSLIVEVHKTQ